MNQRDVQNWLDQYGNAWVEGDPDKLVELFTKQATYRETPFDQPMTGQTEIRRYWQEGASDAQKDVTFSAQVWTVYDDLAVAGWQASFTRVPSGRNVTLDGVFRLKLEQTTDGLKWASLEEWWHKDEDPN